MMPEAFEDSQCGFMFRFDTDVSDGLDTFYALLIAPGINKVKMSLWKDNAWNHSQILEPDPALNSGYDINHVRLEVKKDSMEVFINGIFLANFSEGTLKNRGAIGLILYPSASATDGVVDYVLFDNFVITSP